MLNKSNCLMLKPNCIRGKHIDVFNSFLVSEATYEGFFEIPRIDSSSEIPNKLISFSKAINAKAYDCWIHFYEDDFQFERIWRNPKRYLNLLKKFKGIILPDFSLYRDMPLSMQIWNIYRSRALGTWFQKNGVSIIPNIRFGDYRTYSISCLGIDRNSIISIGTHGITKNRIDRFILIDGINEIIKILHPKVIIIYGNYERMIDKINHQNTSILAFKPQFNTFSILEGEWL